MIGFIDLQKKAMKQLEKDWFELEDTFWDDPATKDLADTMMKIRDLGGEQCFTLSRMICGEPYSFLDDFHQIINKEEFLKLPHVLDNLITRLRYNILDDGYLRLMKLDILDDVDSKSNMQEWLKQNNKTMNRTAIRYFLYTGEWSDVKEIAESKMKTSFDSDFFNPILTSVKTNWFSSLDEFRSFLEVLVDPQNWASFEFTGFDKVEKLMNFYEIENELKQ